MTEKWGVVPHAEDGRILYIRKNGSDNYIDEVAVLYNQSIEKATLMAAAPDLYEALEDLLHQYLTAPSGLTFGDQPLEREKADAALAKARGESQ